MSDTDSDRPRRALEPLDDDLTDDAATSAASPSRGWAPADTLPEDEVSAPDDQPEVSTPIPPPAPTLPEPLQPAPVGRRFSAEPVSEDAVAGAPRRSAASVSSPPWVDEPFATSAVTPDAVTETSVLAEPDGTAGHPRRRLILITAAVVAAAVALSLVFWRARPGGSTENPPVTSTGPADSVSVSPSPAGLDAAQLLVADDLTDLRKSTRWTEAADPTGAAPTPACVELSSTGGAAPDTEASRRFTADRDGGVLVQVAQAMADEPAATTAYQALLSQAASCSDAQLLAVYRIDGLADSATALTVALTDGTQHTLLITRTGRFVGVTDASVTETPVVGAGALSSTIATSLARQCGIATGTCPTTPKASATLPPATDPVGWLAWVDVPLLTPGEGKWTATDAAAPNLVGSQCEDVDLNKLPGTTEAAHRTYLLTDDSKAPEGFGIDQAIYTFSKASAATAMAKTLTDNFAECGDRTLTAKVQTADVSAVGEGSKKLEGKSYVVTQRISDSKTVTFRVGVVAVGTRLVYLLANPSANFDFTDAAWKALVGRAAQRATQFA
ncbi:hypothetical protein [Micropruina sp.]|uniref:hypothetical protein n=1 Tax=Micropruina sp. TaxID=2737536 RepID=UPI0039E5877F